MELDGITTVQWAGRGLPAELLEAASVEGKLFELDAEEVGAFVAEVVDAVALFAAGADAEVAFDCRRARDFEGRILIVREVHRAGVAEIDVDGGEGGVIVDADVLMRAVVNTDDGDGAVVGGDAVVLREGYDGILRRRGSGNGGYEQGQGQE